MKAGLIGSQLREADGCRAVEGEEVVGDVVGEADVLAVTPGSLDGVEVRRVGWKPLDEDRLRIEARGGRAMDVEAVPDEEERAADGAPKVAHKALGVVVADVVVEDLEVQTNAPLEWRNRECGDDGQAVVTIPAPMNGRLAFGCPRSSDERLQHVA